MISATVGREDLEHQLEVSARAWRDGRRVDREALTFLGTRRALLLQLADPWVAAAIVQHSRTLADPIGRFHRTFAVVFTMVFGRDGQGHRVCDAPLACRSIVQITAREQQLPLLRLAYRINRGRPGSPNGHSNAARSHRPRSAAASYVVCRNSISVRLGSRAVRTAS